jgi:hydrogenase maturation protein HypF
VTTRRLTIRVTGVVQGVGYRPFAYVLATDLGLAGFVGNDAAGVFLEAQGDTAALDQLLDGLREGPPLARIDRVDWQDIDVVDDHGFRIVDSADSAGTTSIPPDTAVCDACLAEMRDPADRRFGYPFIACTHCGPRYTIVTGLPYDRPHTTMAAFPLCAACQAEYDDPRSRRFHAQPTACPACGPMLDTTIDAIVTALRDGLVVALKGVGGYHLACDARNSSAVDRLRHRKQRGRKPFALMASALEVARSIVVLDPTAEEALLSPAHPIVLAAAIDTALQESAAPGNRYLGVMLPYAPLHHLLFDAGAPTVLVMTSGNLSDEPICISETEARERLSGVADVMVHHNRPIHVACDDSVLRASGSILQPVRRSRGYAPLPLTLPTAAPPSVAVGGELKTTACVAEGHHAWLSQHIGDTENLETLAMLDRTVDTLTRLHRVTPEAIISDAHPGYLSRRWAHEEASRRGIDHLTVQHHHAHLASLLAEHGWLDGRPVLGFTFDGTGYGSDGTIWGGELLLGSYVHAERVGHLRPVNLPGGDAAIRRPLRSALAHLAAAGVEPPVSLAERAEENELAVVGQMVRTGAGCTPTTSMGRLFDAVAALLDVRSSVDYEGQAAIELEAWAAEAAPLSVDPGAWAPVVIEEGDALTLDPGPTLAAVVAAAADGMDRAQAARLFHEGIAVAVARAAVLVRARSGVDTVGLTGGVFANSVLTAACQGRLAQEGFDVLVHHRVPPNDGGLALGQVAVAAAGGAATAGRA